MAGGEEDGDRLFAIGFVGDYQGSQDSVDYYRPVVSTFGDPTRHFVPITDEWTSANELREITPADLEYTNPFPDAQIEVIAPGAVILVAGANFTDWLRIAPGLKGYAKAIDGYWSGLGGLYTFRIGTRSEFNEIVQGIWNRGVPRLYEALFSPPDERSATLTTTYFRLLSNLTGISMRDQVLLHGTYYHECRNPDYYELWGETSVVQGVFASFEEYESSIRSRIEFLASERIAESSQRSVSSPTPVSARSASWQAERTLDFLRLAYNSQVAQSASGIPEVLSTMEALRSLSPRLTNSGESLQPHVLRLIQLVEALEREEDAV